jgi:nucleotide-binding universal stress UspA family protein
MTDTTTSTLERERIAETIFDRVVCGVDLSKAGRVAARQAAQVVARDGSLLLVTATVGEPSTVLSPAGLGYAAAHALIDTAARIRYCDALTAAREEALPHFGKTRMLRVEGEPVISLLEALEREQATLAVVGCHETKRLPGILLGSVATHLLHKASCSVLVARREWVNRAPRRVIVGVDGTWRSVAALGAAHDLAIRFGCPIDELTDSAPVRALVERARADDLIVLGSRGLHGLRALGSVSERVAHQAPCSVLVVRPHQDQEAKS